MTKVTKGIICDFYGGCIKELTLKFKKFILRVSSSLKHLRSSSVLSWKTGMTSDQASDEKDQ